MGKLGEKLMPIAYISYFAVGFIQLFAAINGVSTIFGISGPIGIICGVLLNWAPFWGTIVGVYGAHFSWGWSWIFATLFMGWPTALFLVAGTMELVGEVVPSRCAN